MKKLILICLTLMILSTSAILSGCGKTESDKVQPATSTSTIKETQSTSDTNKNTITPTVKPADPVDNAELPTYAENSTTVVETTTQKATQATKATEATKETLPAAMNIPKGLISQGEAQNIALEHAGVTQRQSTPTKVELDKEKGKYIYEIDFIAGNMEYEYDINAKTGAIISADKDLIGD